jgi:HNH endonuclease
MTRNVASFASLTDQQLLAEVKTLTGRERETTASLIASLAELDARRLYLGEGFPSLFAYCTQSLHLSEHAAYNRIETARAARKWPLIVQLIADGSVTPTAIRLLAGSLTDVNHRDLLDAATHKTKREVEQLVAALHPQAPVPSIVRKLPAPKPVTAQSSAFDGRDLTSPHTGVPPALEPESHQGPRASPPNPAVIAPLASDRFKVQITITRETHDKLRRVQDLLRHQVPSGDPAVIFDRALTLLLQHLERKAPALANHPRPGRLVTPGSRHVPAAVRREVWRRDGGQCAFIGNAGRCTERGFIEFHHVVPFADGGPATPENLQLRCRTHNAYEAEQHFGTLFVREDQCRYSFQPERVESSW